TGYLFVIVPKGFIPNQDTGQIFGFTEAAQDISFEGMVRNQQALAAVVGQDPNIEQFSSSVGAGGPNALGNTGRIFMRLKPRSDRILPDWLVEGWRAKLAPFPRLQALLPEPDTGRKLTPEQLIEVLRRRLAPLPGMRAFLQNPPLIRLGGMFTKSLYQMTLQGADMKELYRLAPLVEDKVRQLPGLQDVTSDLLITSPQVIVDIDREKASALGVTVGQIEDALYDSYGSRQVSTIYTPSNQYWVIVELLPQYQRDPNALSMLYIRSDKGQLVPLRTVAKLTPAVGPLSVNHLGQLPSVTISFNLKPGVSLGDAVTLIDGAIQNDIPPTITRSYQGFAQAFQSSLKGMGVLLIMAVLVIYLVLGILYESFIHPVTILSGLPSAGFGALATLLLFRSELNIYSFVGIIMLVGIVKKNAIMMIDFALEAQRTEGVPPEKAIYEACLIRFRPIMMTTMAALMGTLPIALGFGAGGEARRPLGLSVEGGLVVSQLLTLYITPVVYIYMEKFHKLFSRGEPALAPAAEVPVPRSV
ncbi:MAG: efflux RND transporter permease subunit, partial [Acidobacteria bacterium]|nr:efflux RND transporter permease subunit [Acidobacteriota bacterium]